MPEFFWAKIEISSDKIDLSSFSTSDALNDSAGNNYNLISDYIILPDFDGGVQVRVADPEEGFHILWSNEDANKCTYFESFDSDDGTSNDNIGKIERFSFNHNKKFMAMYSNIHELGSLLVVESENDSGDLKSILDVNT